jgi:hypothetical protein
MNKYVKQERARYWPLSAELLAKYKDGTHNSEYRDSTFIWRQNGLLHRDEDKPAWIGTDGTLIWRQNDLVHRDEDKPAIIGADSTLGWWQNDQRHRSSGPAVIRANGTLEWWQNGKDITREVRVWLLDTEWQGTPEQITEFKLRFA